MLTKTHNESFHGLCRHTPLHVVASKAFASYVARCKIVHFRTFLYGIHHLTEICTPGEYKNKGEVKSLALLLFPIGNLLKNRFLMVVFAMFAMTSLAIDGFLVGLKSTRRPGFERFG